MNSFDISTIKNIMNSVINEVQFEQVNDQLMFELEHKIAYKIITCIEMDFDITVEYINEVIVAKLEAYDDNDMLISMTIQDDDINGLPPEEDINGSSVTEEMEDFIDSVAYMIELLEDVVIMDSEDTKTIEEVNVDNFNRAMSGV